LGKLAIFRLCGKYNTGTGISALSLERIMIISILAFFSGKTAYNPQLDLNSYNPDTSYKK